MAEKPKRKLMKYYQVKEVVVVEEENEEIIIDFAKIRILKKSWYKFEY